MPSTSVKESCAPGWGRSLRRISRDPAGQESRSIMPWPRHPGAVSQLVIGLDGRRPTAVGDEGRGCLGSDDRRGTRRRARPPGHARLRTCWSHQPNPSGPAPAARPGHRAGAGRTRAATPAPSPGPVMRSCAVFDPAAARPAPPRGDLRTVQEAQQRMEPEGSLPGRRGVLLLPVRDRDRGVEVQPQLLTQVRSGAHGPRPLPAPQPGPRGPRRGGRQRYGPAPATSSASTPPDRTGPGGHRARRAR